MIVRTEGFRIMRWRGQEGVFLEPLRTDMQLRAVGPFKTVEEAWEYLAKQQSIAQVERSSTSNANIVGSKAKTEGSKKRITRVWYMGTLRVF
jgi:hypothetical protein